MPIEPLKWGVLGTGRITRSLAAPLLSSSRHRLAAVASRSLERAQALAADWPGAAAFGDYQALLDDAGVDVVYVALPNTLHAEWTVRAARAGKHVLCEKPLALSLAEMDLIQEAARSAGVVVCEGFMYRHHPQTRQVMELVRSGVLGELRLVRGAFTFTLSREGDIRRQPSLGGGSLLDVGCYPVSYARLVLEAEPLEAFGWEHRGPAGVDEAFQGQLRFPGGRVAQIDCGFDAPFRAQMELVGTEGVLTVPRPFKPGAKEQLLIRRGDSTTAATVAGEEPYLGEVEDMADAVLLGRPPRLSLEDSRGNVAALCALQESARQGRPVALRSQAAGR